MKFFRTTVSFAGAAFLSFVPFSVLAATFTVSTAIPGSHAITTGPNGVAGIVANFYEFALLIGGIMALGAIVWGGVKYTWAAGNPSGQSEGKEWIKSALYGLLLLAGAYVILNTINPQLLNLGLPTLQEVTVPANTPGTGTGTCTAENACSVTNQTGCCPTGQKCQVDATDLGGVSATCVVDTSATCPIPPLTPITDPQALAMENGQMIVWTSSDPNVQANLTKLQAAVNLMRTVVTNPSVGDTMTVNSAYRPLAYQKHFYEIYQDSQMLFNNPSYANIPACNSIISALKAEQNKHGVCKTQSQCLVGTPSCSIHAPHVLGIGVDINLSGPFAVSAINPILQAKNVPLLWQGLGATDPVHFNLTQPAFTSCALQ